MIVVADTSPIHYLVLVGHADVLQNLYERVLIPGAVARELQAASTPPAVKAWLAAAPEWLEVRTVNDPDEPALADLDLGEREAIVLAENVDADAVIIDDRAGRQEAHRRSLRVIGTVRVLDDAAVSGLLDPIVALERLRAAGFYLDAALVTFLTERHNARLREKA
jgi:predicted nucleic acid-binding protein